MGTVHHTINKHAQLVRAAMMGVKALQACGDVLPVGGPLDLVNIALLTFDKALFGQRVTDEKVVIAIHEGRASIEYKSDFVQVTIKDYDMEEGYENTHE